MIDQVLANRNRERQNIEVTAATDAKVSSPLELEMATMAGISEGINGAAANRLESAIESLYRHRFPPEMLARRAAVWKVLCGSWFGRYIPANARVLEVGAGYCEFINNIAATEKVVVDLNPETKDFAAPGVLVHRIAAERLNEVVNADYFDTVFMSNFLEHCRTRDQILAILTASYLALKPGGRVLILGPNFHYCYKQYFDFFDHHLPLTDKAVAEGLSLAGFEIEESNPRTLPLTFKGRLPPSPFLVKIYLQFPLLWRFFGVQFFVVGKRTQ